MGIFEKLIMICVKNYLCNARTLSTVSLEFLLLFWIFICRISPEWKKWIYCNGLKMSNRTTWNKSFNFSVKEIDYTILECLAYSENYRIIVNYLEEKLPASFEIFEHIFKTNLSYDESKSKERAETLIANIFLSTLVKNTKYMLKIILYNFRNFTYYYR